MQPFFSKNLVSEMNTKSQYAIDWPSCLKLTGNRVEIAEEMLSMFIEELPHARASILQAYSANDYKQMLAQVHKLHGAACYCGVPRLKNLLSAIETALRTQNENEINELMESFDSEIESVIATYHRGDYKKIE